MDLLDFARGPGWAFALAVLALGTLWRLIGVLRRPARPDLSAPREGAPSKTRAAFEAIASGLWPRSAFGPSARIRSFNAYAFHVGLVLIVFGYAPHIAFVQRLVGVGWPALPDVVMVLASAVTMLTLLIALWLRVADPVLRQISRPDDLISWAVTFLPIFTGMAVMAGPSDAVLLRDHVIYRAPLAVHLLSLELLMIWFPFGKLMHAVLFAFSRGATGIRFRHRGVRI